jgi:hypothetical protein
VLETALELLDLPFSQLLLLLVLSHVALDAFGYFEGDIGGLSGDGELDEHLGGKVVGREVRSDLESQLQLVLGHLVNERIDPEGRLVVSVDTVVHHQELPIRRVD